MEIFESYAHYYDLLYQDKDYVGEVNFVLKMLKSYVPNASKILELGCGTGAHAVLLAKQGYQIQGIDFSEEMIQQANHRLQQLSNDIIDSVQFTIGDIQEVRLNQKYEVILSLFHVFSYQTDINHLLAAFATVKEHLQSGGIFIFDVWYGPAVLNDRPTVRIKRSENEHLKVTRIAEPILYPNENLVEINYQIFIENKQKGITNELQETHKMRYFFKPEIEFFLQQFDLKIIASREWISDETPGLDTWGVYFVVGN
jgi:ubiquinone/menaquinone biosynthesis C-methylase UbiE